MGFFYLFLVVVAITATALVAKIASRRGVTALALANSLFSISTVLGAIVFWVHGPALPSAQALYISALGGVGGAFAVLAFNQAVRVGHFGYSNAIYRSSFLVPVIFTLLFMGARLNAATAAGIALILAGIFLMSWTPQSGETKAVFNLRWVVLILAAFLLSGAPRVGQTLTSARHIDSILYLFYSYAIGAVILVAISGKAAFQPAALRWGTASAVASYLGVFFTLKALAHLGPQVVFPISLSGPILLGIGCSLALFKERVTARGWTGILFGVSGIVILAIWK